MERRDFKRVSNNNMTTNYHNDLNAASTAKALQAKKLGSSWLVRCPAHDDTNPSLSITNGKNDKPIFYCHAGCDWKDIRNALQHLSPPNYAIVRNTHSKSSNPVKPKLEWSDKAERIWQSSLPIYGTLAERYLLARGCLIPETDHLRFLPKGSHTKHPAMIALISNAVTGKPQSIHFTFLQPNGEAKANIPRPKDVLFDHGIKNGVIRLTHDDAVTLGLGIAEGIETALCCMKDGWQPVWSTINANNMRAFPRLEGIEALTIFADNDSSGAGQKAAQECQKRYRQFGCDARIIMPSTLGNDWADIVEERRYA